jgi:hypothetical protein
MRFSIALGMDPLRVGTLVWLRSSKHSRLKNGGWLLENAVRMVMSEKQRLDTLPQFAVVATSPPKSIASFTLRDRQNLQE